MEHYYRLAASSNAQSMNFGKVYGEQAGHGISSYGGYRYMPVMKGKGFFGRMLQSTVLPMIRKVIPFATKYGPTAIATLFDQVSKGESFKDASKRTFKRTASKVFKDVGTNLGEDSDQEGAGILCRRKRPKTLSLKRKKKQTHRKKPRLTKKHKVCKRRKRIGKAKPKRKGSRRPISAKHKQRLLKSLEKARKARRSNLRNKKSLLF